MITTFDPDSELVLSALRHYEEKRKVVSRIDSVPVAAILEEEKSYNKGVVGKEMNEIFSKYFMYDKSKQLKMNFL
jgi:hypothetical protein